MNPQNKTDGLGIASIVTAFLFPLVGFILGLIGASQAKKEQRSPVLSRIGWILSLLHMIFIILLLVVFLALPNLQRNQRDAMKKNDLAIIDGELKTFYNQNNYYPPTLEGIEGDYPGMYTYMVSPEGCSECKSYELGIELENGDGSKIYKLKSDNL